MSQETLVEKHLRGETTEEEDEMLESNPQAWKDAVTDIIVDCDREMLESKAKSLQEKTPQARLNYEQLKIICLAKKQKAIALSRELKAKISSDNRDANPQWHVVMIEELKAIRVILERMEKVT